MILDTDILSDLSSPRRSPHVQRGVRAVQGPLFTTTINWAEICYGAARHPAGAELRQRYERFVLPQVEMLEFDLPSAEVYGRLRADLEAAGQPLAESDLMIASIALRHDLPLVTGNERHFARIPTLKLVNWRE